MCIRDRYEGIADIVIANNAIIPESLRIKYASEHAREVMIDSINVLKRAKTTAAPSAVK